MYPVVKSFVLAYFEGQNQHQNQAEKQSSTVSLAIDLEATAKDLTRALGLVAESVHGRVGLRGGSQNPEGNVLVAREGSALSSRGR